MNVMGFIFYNAEFSVLLYKKGARLTTGPWNKKIYLKNENSFTNK